MTLADLLLLIAATALAAAVLRATAATTGGGYLRHVPARHSHWVRPFGGRLPFYFFFALYNGIPQILVGCLGVVALSLRGRRSSPIPLSHRPGFVLCAAAVAAAALTTAAEGPSLRWDQVLVGTAHWDLVVNQVIPNAGFAVLGAWVAVALVGRSRPAPSWLDRFGYTLGVVLVVLLALEYGRQLLEVAELI